jgi:hypothetical protein
MPGATGRIKQEVRKLLGAALFFSTGFCMILVAERLLTRGSNIEVASFARAIIGGLIVAKVLLLVDLVPFIDAFPKKPLVANIVWKSSLYIAAAVLFEYIEPLIKNLWHGQDFATAQWNAIEELARPRTGAIVILLAMLLLAFVTLQELTRVLGKDKMRLMFLGR